MMNISGWEEAALGFGIATLGLRDRRARCNIDSVLVLGDRRRFIFVTLIIIVGTR